MDSEKQIRQAVAVSKLYYLEGATQAEIAAKLKISRPTISRALQYARDHQIVRIQVTDPFADVTTLARQLENKYGLKKVVIATPKSADEKDILAALGQAAATYLPAVVVDNDVLGISWGRTLDAVATHLTESERQGVKITYLKGTVANSTRNNYVVDVTKHFNKSFHTQAQILPLPVIFANRQVKEMVTQDRFINAVLTTMMSTTVALFTVGTTAPDATLFTLGYLSPQEVEQLRQAAVGDIISQFVDPKGQLVDKDLTARTMAMPLDHLRNIRESILIAGGVKKLPAIRAALAGQYANTLVTDLNNAQRLLK
ncbi:sugar-binding transcriptional regulator [Limosilactobacillus sp.]|uniref:sugar-binding transcriptional regulator n=1 Tax=Limosilactobacillus sp. TaxID=2773925 RepID=UPI003F066722